MATPVQIVKFEGDVRVWKLNDNNTETAVCDDADDAKGNRPLECSAVLFEYAAGDKVQIKSRGRARDGQIIYSKTAAGAAGLTITMQEVPPVMAALMFAGITQANVVTTTAAITDETHTVATKGVWINLNKEYLRASPAPVVLVLMATIPTAQYEIDYRRGRIKIKSDAADVDVADVIKVSYTHNTYTMTEILGGLEPEANFRFEFDFKNQVTEDDWELEVPKATMTREGSFDLLGNEPISPQIKGDVVLVTGESAPYYVRRKVVVSA